MSTQKILPGHPQIRLSLQITGSYMFLPPFFELLEENTFCPEVPNYPKPFWMAPKGHDMAVSRTYSSPPSIHGKPTTAVKPQWRSSSPKQTCHYQAQINWCHLRALLVGFEMEAAQQQWLQLYQTSRHLQVWPLAELPGNSILTL